VFKPGIHPWAHCGGNPEHHEYDHAGGTHHGVDIDPTATISAYCSVDGGMNAPTRVGARTVLLQHAHVGHDAWIGDDVTLATGCVIGGHAVVGDGARIGLNATIVPHRTVGAGAVVGAAANVVHDVPPGVTVAGNPARIVTPRSTLPHTERPAADRLAA
jgi:acyl-[acyl carrier protein]--UDP-N-acetylglucosamine O-acyltransferase